MDSYFQCKIKGPQQSVKIEMWKICGHCAAFARKEVNFTGHSHYAWFQHHGNWTQRLTKRSQLKPGCSFYCLVLFVSLCFLTSCFWEQYLEKATFIAAEAKNITPCKVQTKSSTRRKHKASETLSYPHLHLRWYLLGDLKKTNFWGRQKKIIKTSFRIFRFN